ncbi:unnamed protein product [Calypogeia fissa]
MMSELWLLKRWILTWIGRLLFARESSPSMMNPMLKNMKTTQAMRVQLCNSGITGLCLLCGPEKDPYQLLVELGFDLCRPQYKEQ